MKTIGFTGRIRNDATRDTVEKAIALVEQAGFEYWVADHLLEDLTLKPTQVCRAEDMAEKIDLAIVIGGDGSMLKAAKVMVDAGVPLVGVNRGRFGFLADIAPDAIELELPKILAGDYRKEARILLEVEIPSQNITHHALNDVVLVSGNTAHMTEFELSVDGEFVSFEHSDGMIVATPTGSTAYALSGGGPIVHPASNAIVLVPMFSHSLTSRPLVLSAESEVQFKVGQALAAKPCMSCDGDIVAKLEAEETVIVRQKTKRITLLHPKSYRYFDNLGRKLHWGRSAS